MRANPKLSLLLILSLFMNCTPGHRIEVQGHRGFKGSFPENSLPAFEKAIELGVHTLEMDVVISKDKKVVVSHEPYMNALICLNPQGGRIDPSIENPFNMYELNYSEIQEFDCGSIGHPDFPQQEKMHVFKPLLKEVLRRAEEQSKIIKYNIELKSDPAWDGLFTPAPVEFVALVLEVISDFELGDRVNLQSFDLRVLEAVHKQSPETIQALLVDENETIFTKLDSLSFKPQIISPHYKLLQPEIVEEMHNREFLVIPWTVNSISDMQAMIEMKVDAIITDYPDVLMALMEY